MTSSCNGRDDSKVKVFFPIILNDKEILLINKKKLFFFKSTIRYCGLLKNKLQSLKFQKIFIKTV